MRESKEERKKEKGKDGRKKEGKREGRRERKKGIDMEGLGFDCGHHCSHAMGDYRPFLGITRKG